MTIDLKQLRADADGFRGSFEALPEDEHCPDRLVFTSADCDCEEVISDSIEQHVAEPLVRMLNAVGPLLDIVENDTCARHAGQEHGAEAEELRSGIEQTLKNTKDVDPIDAPAVLEGLRKSLLFLLDRIDARDSLAYLEARDERDSLRAENERLRGDLLLSGGPVDEAVVITTTEAATEAAAVVTERDEYHSMLRSILALCDDSTRASLGPDAPLRAVQKVITERDSARAEVERLKAALTLAAGQLRYVVEASEHVLAGTKVEVADGYYRGAIEAIAGTIDSATKGGS